MCDFKVVCLLVIAVHLSTSSNFVKYALKYAEHNKRVTTKIFPCGAPQRRLLSLREIVGNKTYNTDYKDKISKIKPYGSILYRCQNSGCCERYNQRCEARNEDTVELTFQIDHVPYRYFTVTTTNHTECACQKVGDDMIK